MSNPFFKNHGPINISEILKFLNLKSNDLIKDQKVSDIKDLNSAKDTDVTFFSYKKIQISSK